ncbi:unnamed protein product [Dovyalis caffra]|uniref:Uncharacterized protein n=1 Tax=Dovyalis caffra TaxID=77055 RepID=A0AAV1SBN6_9ROSI|nr:unnamed protein product [Dovyalis caffra]
MGRNITSPVLSSIPKDARLNQQNTHQQGWVNQPQPTNGGAGSVGWANPVKRLRTDAVYNLMERIVVEFSLRVYKWPFAACTSAVNIVTAE